MGTTLGERTVRSACVGTTLGFKIGARLVDHRIGSVFGPGFEPRLGRLLEFMASVLPACVRHMVSQFVLPHGVCRNVGKDSIFHCAAFRYLFMLLACSALLPQVSSASTRTSCSNHMVTIATMPTRAWSRQPRVRLHSDECD